MAVTMKQMALAVTALGLISFVFGIVAENKKPAAGTPIPGKGVVICKYSSDPTVPLGFLSVGFLVATTVVGYLSLFYPYKGKSVPNSALFQSASFSIFFNIAVFTAGLAAALILWPTIQEHSHLSHTVHHDPDYQCPTAKTGLLGGGALVSLDSALFWLVALMLADNAREDYFDETEKDVKGGIMMRCLRVILMRLHISRALHKACCVVKNDLELSLGFTHFHVTQIIPS